MSDTPNQPTDTAFDILTKLLEATGGTLGYGRFRKEAAHQLYLAELERIGSDYMTEDENYKLAYAHMNDLRADLREKARLFYGQDKEKI